MSRAGATIINSGSPTRPNYIINGGMDFWQRGSNFLDLGDRYTADRWFRFKQNGGGTGLRTELIANVNGLEVHPGTVTNRAMRWGRKSGDTDVDAQELVYAMESKDATNLSGKDVVLSFFVRRGSDFNADLIARVTAGEGFDQPVIGAWTNDVDVLDDSIANADLPLGFERVYFTFPVPQVKTQMRIIVKYIPTGTAGANEYIDITSVQLEEGISPSPFKRSGLTIADEFTNCQRYFEKSYDVDTGLDTVTSVGRVFMVSTTTFGEFDRSFEYKASKRVIPILSDHNRTNIGPGLGLLNSGRNGFAINIGAAAASNANFHWSADAEL